MFKHLSTELQLDFQDRNIIIAGPVGSGKTQCAKYIIGDYNETDESKMSGFSITKGVNTIQGKYIPLKEGSEIKIRISASDTEGYGADKYSRDELKNQLYEHLKFETKLHCVILIASFERFRNGLKEDLAHLINVIKTLGLSEENLILCFTHCEFYTDMVKHNYKEEFLEENNLKINDNDILFTCFANLSEINENFEPIILPCILNSIKQLRYKIYEKNKTINTASKINKIESE